MPAVIRRRTAPFLVAASLLGALTAPPAARASDVEINYHRAQGSFPAAYRFSFTGASGESNDVLITGLSSGLQVRDAAARLGTRAGCRSLGDHDAECGFPTGAPLDYFVDLGVGNDVATLAGRFDRSRPAPGPLVVDAGVGNDVVKGSDSRRAPAKFNGRSGDDVLTGGPSAEVLIGGPGRDRIDGGGGNDSINDDEDPANGENTSDTFDGGDGTDTVSYDGRDPAGPLEVDLTRGIGGFAGERDELHRIENVASFGNGGPETLVGDDGPNTIYGSFGPTTIRAAGGDDRLTDPYGNNTFDAGAGDDVIQPTSLDWRRDDVTCGPGIDRVTPNPGTLVRADCELLLQYEIFVTSRNPKIRRQPVGITAGSTLAFRVPCRPASRRRTKCRIVAGIAETVAYDPPPGAVSRWVRRGRTARIDVPLTDAQRQELEAGGFETGVYVASRAGRGTRSALDYRFAYRTLLAP